MKTIILALACIGLANGFKILPWSLDGRIVGGEDTTIEKYPYQVSVQIFGSHTCGGSIINSRVVATAAHCVYTSINVKYYKVSYGSTDVTKGNIIEVERFIKNENYDSSSLNNDVALIFLVSDIPFGPTAQPIALATQVPTAGQEAVVTGWGALAENGDSPDILQVTTVLVVSNVKCREEYDGVKDIKDEMMCAGVVGGGKDACQGDSGGPLVVNNQLAGIVSWGAGCARPDYSGVYANVANLRNWIDANLA